MGFGSRLPCSTPLSVGLRLAFLLFKLPRSSRRQTGRQDIEFRMPTCTATACRHCAAQPENARPTAGCGSCRRPVRAFVLQGANRLAYGIEALCSRRRFAAKPAKCGDRRAKRPASHVARFAGYRPNEGSLTGRRPDVAEGQSAYRSRIGVVMR